MSKNIVIHAESRSDLSSSHVRKLRQSGLVPGVLYGKNKAIKIAVTLSNLPKEHTRSSVVKLVLGNSEKSVLMREVQVDPLTDKPIHFDFQEISATDLVRVHVPLNFVGLTREQEKEGTFSIRIRYLEVKAPVSKLPESIDVDVSKIKGGESVQLFDLSLPSGLSIRTGKGKNVALASIVKA